MSRQLKLLNETILYVLAASAGLAQVAINPGWHSQTPLPNGKTLRAVAALDVNTAVAVGDGGTILRTTDGGVTWNTQVSPTTANLHAIAFSGARTGAAVGAGGTILWTNDGGVIWALASSGLQNLCGVSFANAQTAIVVGFTPTSVIDYCDSFGTKYPGVIRRTDNSGIRPVVS